MTDPPEEVERLDAFRRRKAEAAADRAAFEERRRHGLKARHRAKLVHLAARRPKPDEPVEEEMPASPDVQDPNAA
jgi:hypothetical protein